MRIFEGVRYSRVGHGSGPSAGRVGSGPTLSQTIFVVQFYA